MSCSAAGSGTGGDAKTNGTGVADTDEALIREALKGGADHRSEQSLLQCRDALAALDRLVAERDERLTKESGKALIQEAQRWSSAYDRCREDVAAVEARAASTEAELLELRALTTSEDPVAALARERRTTFEAVARMKAQVDEAEKRKMEYARVYAIEAQGRAAAEALAIENGRLAQEHWDRAERLTVALEAVEWNGSAWIGNQTCPECGAEHPTHDPGCDLHAALAKP